MPADRLSELLASLAAQDAAALVEEARAAGRAEAKRELERLWRDAYMQATAHTEEEAPRREGEAWWVYGVVNADDAQRVSTGMRGVDERAAVELVSAGPLAALVSAVPLDEFGDERLREHLEDLTWVERVARAHEAVLEAAMDGPAVVPLRLCTICLTRERVADMLREQGRAFESALTVLAGRSEWGVKVFAPTVTVNEDRSASEDPQAYLDRKRNARSLRERVHRAAAECAESVHAAVAELAVAAISNAPQHREAHGRDADMLLNGAYLIDDERRDELEVRVAALGSEHADYLVELTGPWPPYNFVEPAAGAIS